jgi:hypothetical protein
LVDAPTQDFEGPRNGVGVDPLSLCVLSLEDDLGTTPEIETEADRVCGYEGRGSANDSENRERSPKEMT